jgi:hypothetical protein
MCKLRKKYFIFLTLLNAALAIACVITLIISSDPPGPSKDQARKIKSKVESYVNNATIKQDPSFLVKIYKTWESGNELVVSAYKTIRALSMFGIIISTSQLLFLIISFYENKNKKK